MRISGLRTIVDLFLENVDRVADQTFIRYAGREFTYGTIGRASERLAQTLGEAGIGYQSRVALAMSNRPAFLVAFLGVLRCGATVIPLNTLYKPDEARYAIQHSRSRAVLTEQELAGTIADACRITGRDLLLLVGGGDDEGGFAPLSDSAGDAKQGDLPASPSPGDLAGIFYTSGTTARPKGVMISHENMMYSAEVTIKSLGIGAGDVPLLAFPLFHVNSLFYGVLTAIVLRGAIGLARGFSVSGYWQDAVQTSATWTPGITGPLVELLLAREASEIETKHRLRFAVGGNFKSLDQIEACRQRFGVELLPGWSMTETVSLGSLHPVSRPAPIPMVTGIGYPTLGQEIRLVREDGSDAQPGEPGEIYYRSPSFFIGYLDDETATREAFTADGWFRSGDVACMNETGYLAFVDRKKEMIKTKGENVAAAEIERVLNAHPGVLESAAIGVPDPEGIWGERVEAYVVRTGDGALEAAELTRWAGTRLADFKVPRNIHFIDQLPKTALGKIQRQKLRSK